MVCVASIGWTVFEVPFNVINVLLLISNLSFRFTPFQELVEDTTNLLDVTFLEPWPR
jgi:hypothetical protein